MEVWFLVAMIVLSHLLTHRIFGKLDQRIDVANERTDLLDLLAAQREREIERMRFIRSEDHKLLRELDKKVAKIIECDPLKDPDAFLEQCSDSDETDEALTLNCDFCQARFSLRSYKGKTLPVHSILGWSFNEDAIGVWTCPECSRKISALSASSVVEN